MKQEKYSNLRKGIKNLYKDHTVTQINVVINFLGGYYTKMEKELNKITGTDKETEYIIIKCQKWFFSQNNEIILWVCITIITVLHVTRKQQSIARCHPHCCKRTK